MGSKVVVGPRHADAADDPADARYRVGRGHRRSGGTVHPGGKSVTEPPPPTQETNPLAPGLDLRAHAASVGDIQVVRNSDLRSRGFYGIGAMPIAPSLSNSDGSEQSVATAERVRGLVHDQQRRRRLHRWRLHVHVPEPGHRIWGGLISGRGFCCDQVVTYVPASDSSGSSSTGSPARRRRSTRGRQRHSRGHGHAARLRDVARDTLAALRLRPGRFRPRPRS